MGSKPEVHFGKCRVCRPSRNVPINERGECRVCATLASIPRSWPRKVVRPPQKRPRGVHPIIGLWFN